MRLSPDPSPYIWPGRPDADIRPPTMNKIVLLRHGENRANLTKQFSYRVVDYPLNEKGILQAQQTGHFLKGKQINAIFSSPLKRALQTARIVAEILGLSVTTTEAFREINVGELELKAPTEEVWQTYREVIKDWISGKPETTFPDGENYHQLWQRFHRGLTEITARHTGEKILIVGHGGIFTLPLPDLCPETNIRDLFQAEAHNCALTEILVQSKNGRLTGELIQWADAGHLHGKAAEFVPGTPSKGELLSGDP